MARGRAPNYEATREEILAQAARLFANLGYAATSMNEVAEACGVTKPTLYHYVRDKHDLLMQICQTHVDELVALVQEVQGRGLAPREHLQALVCRFMHVYGQAQHQHRVLTEDLRFLQEADRQRLQALERQVVQAFADAVLALRPELRGHKLDKPVTMLLFGMMNWTFTWLRPDGAFSYESLAPLVAELFLGGLMALQPTTPHTTP
ncbi:TetR/AcrR family transcriptional regulator [Roseateles sp. BYS180W]|uniref:TetR/AcrR family transcriptional regulator n=1 Tax=Roseateles rivi TaxID=3299028 RepID=A0ABW7FYC8_9BURK